MKITHILLGEEMSKSTKISVFTALVFIVLVILTGLTKNDKLIGDVQWETVQVSAVSTGPSGLQRIRLEIPKTITDVYYGFAMSDMGIRANETKFIWTDSLGTVREIYVESPGPEITVGENYVELWHFPGTSETLVIVTEDYTGRYLISIPIFDYYVEQGEAIASYLAFK